MAQVDPQQAPDRRTPTAARNVPRGRPVRVATLRGPAFLVTELEPSLRALLPSERALEGRPLFEAAPELERTDAAHVLHDAYATGELRVVEDFEPNQLRLPLAVELLLQPQRGPDGRTESVAVLAHDVSARLIARRRTEALAGKLAEREDRLRLMLEVSEVGTWEYDVVGNRVSWSAEVERLWGFAPGSFDGRPDTVHARVHPEDAHRHRETILESIARAQAYEIEHRIVKPDGEVRWMTSRGRVLEKREGRVVRLGGVVFDITDGKRAELERELLMKELATERARLAAVLDNVPAGVLLAEAPSGRILLGNAQIPELLRHPVLPSRSVDDYADWVAFHPDGRKVSAHEWPLARALQGEHVPGEDYLYQRGDGTRAWIRVAGAPLHDGSGGIRAGIVAMYDVDREKRAEEERDRFFRLAPDLFCIASIDGRLRRVNEAFPRLLGWSEEELCGAPLVDFAHPGDRATLQSALERLRESPYTLRFENRLRCADGTYRWLSWSASAAPEHGIFYAAARDVTEGRDLEEFATRLQQATSALSRASTVAEVARCVTSSARTALGATAGVIYRDAGMGALQLLHAEGFPTEFITPHHELSAEAVLPVADVFRSGRALWIGSSEEAQARYPTAVAGLGSSHHAIAGLPMVVEGQTVGVLSCRFPAPRAFSAAEQLFLAGLALQAAQALERAQLFATAEAERRRAEEANRAKDEFLAVVSHELRTPLTAMLGYATLLRGGALREDQRQKAIEVIERNVRTQAQLIDDLLDISRIVTGKMRLRVVELDPRAVAQAALDAVRPAAAAKELRLVAELPSSRPLQGDPDRLQQVIWNLLSNAIKFTPRGGEVALRLQETADRTELTVVDTGPGIEPEFLPHVFERFRQADSSTTRAYGGLGLGLAIVKHLVELHGGTVTASSAGEGLGATFTVSLPRAAPALVAGGRRVRPITGEPLALERPPQLRGARLLVVDDEPDAREMISALLGACGAQVTVVDSAAQALAVLGRERFDGLVSDIGMREMDGYALIQRVRALPPEQGGRTPAIALTAYARTEDRTRALLAGFTTHVAKPVDPAELVVVVANVLPRADAK